jgi:hypothetical protein
MPPKAETIHVDRVRLTASWAAWWAMFVVVCTGVWYLRGAKATIEQAVIEVKELRVEMKATQDKQHQLELDMRGVKTKLGISSTQSGQIVTASN